MRLRSYSKRVVLKLDVEDGGAAGAAHNVGTRNVTGVLFHREASGVFIIRTRAQRYKLIGVLVAAVACATPTPAKAAPAPSASLVPAASASPSAPPTPVPGLRVSLDGSNVFIDQATGGPGIQPPEGPGFAAGSPLSPNTPYDLWTNAPETPGVAGVLLYDITGSYRMGALTASALLGAGFVQGSISNAAFHGENLQPALNPHIGSAALPYGVVFPTHAGQDDASVLRISLVNASVGDTAGAWRLTGGYFDLAQTQRFVFIAPSLTNITPSLGVATAESLGDGPPALDSWPTPPPGLPLYGADLTLHSGEVSAEFTDAALPALAGTGVHFDMTSVFVKHRETAQYAIQVMHLWEGGVPISTTTMYGADAKTVPGPQGNLPVSTLGGQRQTLAGLSATFPAAPKIAVLVEVGRAWYDADSVLLPGSQRPGGFYHVAFTRTQRKSTATVEGFRFEPRYATVILPYGVPENVWSAAWSWPGQWLKSTYELNDNTALGANRQGYRLKYAQAGDVLAWRVSFATYHQIEPALLSNVNQTGYVDGFFLPQADNAGTLGIAHQYAAWLAWHPAFGDLTLDYVNDTQHRDALPAYPADLVTYQSPQVVFTYARHLSPSTLVAAGYGRYAMHGMWATTPVNYGQSVFFAGVETAQSPHASLLVELRSAGMDGVPSIPPSGSPPNFGSTIVLVEQRIHV